MNYLAFLLETATETPSDAANQGGLLGGMMMPILMIVMLVAMWWFTSRSQKKRDKEAQDMRDALQVGDEVTTIGGIIGKVVSIKGETFVLETTKDKTKIRFLKGAIRTVDVKAADLAAQVLEAQEAKEEKDAEPAAEDESKKK